MNGKKLSSNEGFGVIDLNFDEDKIRVALFRVIYRRKLKFIIPIKFIVKDDDDMISYVDDCVEFVRQVAIDLLSSYPDFNEWQIYVPRDYDVTALADSSCVRFDTDGDLQSIAHDEDIDPGYNLMDDVDATEYWYFRGRSDSDVIYDKSVHKHSIEAPTLGMLTSILEDFLKNGWYRTSYFQSGFVACDDRPLWNIEVAR